MTPQERDLITALIERLRQQRNQPKDPEADALIRQAVSAQPDIPYLLVQTVLIQDMALQNAERQMAELQAQVDQRTSAPAPTSFLGNAARSMGFGGPWGRAAAPQQQPGAPMAGAPVSAAPLIAPGGGSGFLRQAAATAAGIAGGALLFEGIQSLFGPHYGGGWLGGLQQQPGLSETVINNYYGDEAGHGRDLQADAPGQLDDSGFQNADYSGTDDLGGQDFADNSGDFGGDGGNFDV